MFELFEALVIVLEDQIHASQVRTDLTRRLAGSRKELELELELELIQYQMTQKPMLRCEVGARSLRASSHA